MKRSIGITALAAALGLSALLLLAVRLDKTALPTDMAVLGEYGDRRAAEGLMVQDDITLGGFLRWDSVYDVAAGTNSAVFSFDGSGKILSPSGELTFPDGTPYSSDYPYHNLWYLTARCLVADEDGGDPVYTALLEKAARENQSRQRLRVKDYYDTYPIELAFYSADTYFFQHQPNNMSLLPFDRLRIPAAEEDYLDITVSSWGMHLDEMHVKNRILPAALPLAEGVVATVKFAFGAEPEASWAPEGFGLWYFPVVRKDTAFSGGVYADYLPDAQQAELVFPLDITRQNVTDLVYGRDGELLLTVTENEQLVLYVLDAATFTQRQRLVLGAAEISQSVYTDASYPRQGVVGDSETVTDYGSVSLRVEEDFLAALLNGHTLAVLSPAGSGYAIDFTCESPALVNDSFHDGTPFLLPLQAAEAQGIRQYDHLFALNRLCEQSFSVLPMDYRHGRLVITASIAYSGKALVEVYSADGLMYAALLQPQIDSRDLTVRNAESYPRAAWE